jgi:hypothetical protein
VDGFSPVKGKCFYWREQLSDDWGVRCTCFVEGDFWEFTVDTVPGDCPRRLHCRYYTKGG